MRYSVNFITDQKGRKKAVQVPIREWEKLMKERDALLEYKKLKLDMFQVISELEDAVRGKKKLKSLRLFLDEL